jgi:transcriptional regulator with XRE-family HTH domain
MSTEQSPNPLDQKPKIGERLRKARDGRNLTQAALAKAAGVGRSTIVHYETGKILPGGMELIKLAKALNVSPNYILSGTERFFDSDEPEHVLASGDVAIMASRVVLCLMALDQEVRESFSALLMNMIRQKLGAVRFEEFAKVLDSLEPYMRKLVPDMGDQLDGWLDGWMSENIPPNLLDNSEG